MFVLNACLTTGYTLALCTTVRYVRQRRKKECLRSTMAGVWTMTVAVVISDASTMWIDPKRLLTTMIFAL